MLQLRPCHVPEEQEQSLLDVSARQLLVRDETAKAGSTDIVPDLDKPGLVLEGAGVVSFATVAAAGVGGVCAVDTTTLAVDVV